MRLAALFLCAASAWAAISPAEYRARRQRLTAAAGGEPIVLAGATEADHGDIRSGFWQEANFLYLTGWREPGATLLLAAGEEILFLPQPGAVRTRYTGPKLSPADPDAPRVTGFGKVMDETALPAVMKRFTGKVHTLTQSESFARLERLLAGRDWADIAGDLARLRMVKSPAEIALIRSSINHTIAGHRAGWARLAPGLFEYQLANTVTCAYFDRGCERNAYRPIVGSGPNSVILHYAANRRRMTRGDVAVVDIGAECADYAADITRTVPVSGRFTARQREVYQAVLDAHDAAIAAAKPGLKLLGTGPDSLNGIAKARVASHGFEPYYLHAVGHHLGLDVHDPVDPDLALAPGMVVTIEPGIYIADENLGIRIEDVILITPTGAEVLSAGLPNKLKDLEKALRKR